MNFARGFNHSCISVAYMSAGELRAAAVYNPYVDEMFTAVKGEGAYLNGRRLHVSDAPLSDSVVCYGTSPYSTGACGRDLPSRSASPLTRVLTCAAKAPHTCLCSVAAGRAGLYFEMQVSLWDYAAGALLVREAGGVCQDIRGAELPFDGSKPTILAGGSHAVMDFLKLTEGGK